jgi:hypothetical protein
MNWNLLNKKVLKLIRCEVTDEEIDSFASRRSSTLAIDFLRLLKARLLAYEPLYLSGQYSVDPVSQARLTAQLSTSQTRSTTRDNDPPPLPPPSAPPPPSASFSTSSRKPSMSMSQSTSSLSQFASTSATSTSEPGPTRRPSMMKSQQILKKCASPSVSLLPPLLYLLSLAVSLVDKQHKKKLHDVLQQCNTSALP